MDCRRIEKLIPLYVEDDLEIDDASQVLVHAKACEGCREMIAEYEASQNWLRSSKPPEFDDALLDRLKRDVMIEIGAGRQRPRFLNFFAALIAHERSFAASAAVLIIIAALAFYFKSGNSNSVSESPDLAQESRAPSTSPRHDGLQKGLKEASKAISAKAARLTNRLSSGEGAAPLRLAKHRKERPGLHPSDNVLAHRKHEDKSSTVNATNATNVTNITMSAGSKPERMTRIEFQTTDPNIRIIWLSPEATGSQSFDPMTETD